MGLFNKIITAIRGGAREIGETIVDANGLRIFEQEIKDSEENLEKAKKDLTEVMAKEMQAKRKVEELTKDIEKHEGYVAKALEKGDEALALEVAEKMTELASELEVQTSTATSFGAHCSRLKDMIKKTAKALADMKRQFVMVKTTESVQKATQSITTNYASSGSKLLTAKESLDRIKNRQKDLDDRMAAGDILEGEFEGKDLEAKLREAGIGEGSTSAQDILDKIKAKKKA